ncbi:ABC transporter permease [Spirosoma sp.]|uniref:ABC transporter permease n=1 Tax=Spirosoma sp. TaxID=1899569 RepID=UPI00260EAE48|nr:ABC transporter permease [Spirosoma sp.]MCX6217543.1 ABC transporter permease [Spirosoma sp.]
MTHPPRWAQKLLEALGHPDTQEEVQGDLLELYDHWVQTMGKRRANWRYSLAALKLLRPLAKPKPQTYSPPFTSHPDMLRNYVKIATRNLVRNRVYSAINIGGLALGMVCCLLIALYVYDELSYDRFNANFAHIYRVTERQTQPEGIFDVAVTPGPLAPALEKDFPEVQRTTRVGQWHGLLTKGRRAIEPEQFLIVDPSFFSLFSYPLIMGDTNTIFHGPNELIFSEATAERFFGADWRLKNLLGQSITLNKDQTFTLVGVAKNPPTQSHIQFDVLMPFKWLERNDEWSMKWNSNSYHTYLQLRPDVAGKAIDPTAFADKLRGQLKQYQSGNETPLLLQPLSDIYLYSKFAFGTDYGKRSDITYINIFVAVGLIVLLIAVINFINLATARASQRAKEVGVRKSVGAQRSSLVTQFLSEALLMTTLAMLVSLLLAELLLPVFNNLAEKSMAIPYRMPAFWLVIIGLTAVVSLLTGLYPAFFLSSFRPVAVLKTGIAGYFSSGQTGRNFRQSLVVGQFVLSISLAISTVVIYRQLAYLQSTKLGFDKSHLLNVRLKGDLKQNALRFKTDVSQLPGVAQASMTTSNLVDMNNSTTIEWEGQTPKDEFLITQMNVDADFIRTTGMSMVAGRNFSAQITSDTLSKLGTYLINETAAKRMGWTPASALGKKVKFWGTDGTVIGVVKDFHFRPLHVSIEPFILRFRPKEFYFDLLVKTKPGMVASTLPAITSVYKKLDPNYPISYGFVDQDLDRQYRSEQRIGQIILYFSILTILVSCLGLFGLTAFTAEQRTKEIGIRKVLGASVVSIVALLSKDFLKLVLIALIIASPIAWYAMNRWLQSFAYKTSFEWWMPALAGLVAICIALLTTSFQSIKAAIANPVKSLRNE